MKKLSSITKIASILFAMFLTFGIYSCGNSTGNENKAYNKFQKDSIELCTKTPRLVEAAVLRAFDAVPENNGYWKKDKVTVNYDNSLQYWVGVVDYHYDRNNMYYKTSKTFYVKYWYEMEDGSPKNGKLFYKIWD